MSKEIDLRLNVWAGEYLALHFWWGSAARFFKLSPYFKKLNMSVIFDTLFQA